jgi:hypothetical protein
MANVVLAVMMMYASVSMSVTKGATIRRAVLKKLHRALPDWGEGTSNGPGDPNHECMVDFSDSTGRMSHKLNDCQTLPLDPACIPR